ncbi:MAG: hypothetical protein Devi2KO_15050 [Devosia indica]
MTGANRTALCTAFAAAITLSGCASTAKAPPTVESMWADMQAREREYDRRNTLAFPEDLAAKGIRRCGISNLNSVTVSKETGGSWRLFVSDTYPLTQTYVLLNGQRLQGREDHGIALSTAAIAALKSEQELTVNWTHWPSGGDRQEVITMTGFAQDFDRCENFLAGRGGIEQFT